MVRESPQGGKGITKVGKGITTTNESTTNETTDLSLLGKVSGPNKTFIRKVPSKTFDTFFTREGGQPNKRFDPPLPEKHSKNIDSPSLEEGCQPSKTIDPPLPGKVSA